MYERLADYLRKEESKLSSNIDKENFNFKKQKLILRSLETCELYRGALIESNQGKSFKSILSKGLRPNGEFPSKHYSSQDQLLYDDQTIEIFKAFLSYDYYPPYDLEQLGRHLKALALFFFVFVERYSLPLVTQKLDLALIRCVFGGRA